MHEQSRHLPELGRGQVTIETWAEKTTCATTRNKDMGGGGGRDLDRPIRAYGRATENEPLHLFANPPQTCLRAFSWPRARRPGNKRWQCELAVELLDYQVRARIFPQTSNLALGMRLLHTHIWKI